MTSQQVNQLKEEVAKLDTLVMQLEKQRAALEAVIIRNCCLPPPRLGPWPPAPSTNGAHPVPLERRRGAPPEPQHGALLQGVTDAIDAQEGAPFTVITLLGWLRINRAHLISKNLQMAHSSISATVCRLVKRGQVEPVGRDGKRRTYRRVPENNAPKSPGEQYAAFKQELEVGKTVEN